MFIDLHKQSCIGHLVTIEDTILTNSPGLLELSLYNVSSTYEEADARLVHDTINCVKNAFENVVLELWTQMSLCSC